MKCKNCGANLDVSAKFCHKCGMKIKKKKLCQKLFAFPVSLMIIVAIGICILKGYYSGSKYLAGMVNYINDSQYQEALRYYNANPFLEKDNISEMNEIECQLIALYYYADFINYVVNISESEIADKNQGEAIEKYKKLTEVEEYLCESARKNVNAIHSELISCKEADEAVDECYESVFEGVALIQDIRNTFLKKRKSMGEKCEGYSIQELKNLCEKENDRWLIYIEKRDEKFAKLRENTDGIKISGQGGEVYLLENLGAPFCWTIESFYRYSDLFVQNTEKWVLQEEKIIKEQFPNYEEENIYQFRNAIQVEEPLPFEIFGFEITLVKNMEEIIQFQTQYESTYKETIDKLKEDATILWARNSKKNMQEIIIPNLEKIK